MTMEATHVMNKEEDLRVPILTELDARECVVRISAGGKILPAFKATTLDFAATGREKTRRLRPVETAPRPLKYVEPNTKASANLMADKPQQTRPEPMSLMELLSKQSSHRNKGAKL